ncbi:MAG: hypothetical protein ACI9IT_001459 [Glaciecola sp.]|jgi:hypothetical protein
MRPKIKGSDRVHTVMPGAGEYEEHKRGINWTIKIKQALEENSFVLYAQEIFSASSSF